MYRPMESLAASICLGSRNARMAASLSLSGSLHLPCISRSHSVAPSALVPCNDSDCTPLSRSASSSGLILVHRLSQTSERPAIHDELVLAVQVKGPWGSDASINPQLAFHPRQKVGSSTAALPYSRCKWGRRILHCSELCRPSRASGRRGGRNGWNAERGRVRVGKQEQQ